MAVRGRDAYDQPYADERPRSRWDGLWLTLGLAALGGALYRFYGPPRLPERVPGLDEITSALTGTELSVAALIYLIGSVLWLLWGWLALSLILQVFVGVAEAVTRGARWVRGLRRLVDGLSPAIIRRVAKPVAVGAVALMLARSALPSTAAAAGSKHAVVTLAPLRDHGSDHTRNRGAIGSREQRTAEHTVRPGDNLWEIADRYYGSGEEYTRIIAANKGHTMIDAHGNHSRFSTILQPGWVLVIPAGKPQVGQEGPKHFYVVDEGDTLKRIAARLLGDESRWPEIYELNKGEARLLGGRTLTDPDLIWPGLRLEIPPRELAGHSTDPEPERPTSTNKPPNGRRETKPRPGGEKPKTSAGEAERGSGNREAGPRRTGAGAGTERGEGADCGQVPPKPTGTAERGPRRNIPDVVPSPTAPTTAPPIRTPSVRPSPTAALNETPTGGGQVEPTAVRAPVGPEQPDGDRVPPELAAGGAAASVAVVGGGLYLGWRLRRRGGRASARAGELREDGFVQPENSRRLAQRLHEGEFEPAVTVADRVAVFLAQRGLERISVLTAHQCPEDVHLILTGGLAEETHVFRLTDALSEALDTDVQAYATRDRDVALRVRLLEPGSWKGSSAQPNSWSPLLVALGAPTPRHTLYANWRALGNVLAAGSTAGGVDTLMASIIAALISRRSPKELQFRIAAEHQRLPTGLLGLPHQVSDVVDPGDREGVAEAVETLHAELLTRMESSRDARSGEEPPQFVLVVGELACLDVDQAILNTIALSGPEHGVRLLAATTRVMEIGRKMLPLFNTRLVLRVETEDESVELVGWDEAAGLSGGGDMLLWLGGRATIRLRAFRNEPEQLDQLGRLMRETYGSGQEDTDRDPQRGAPSSGQGKESSLESASEAVSLHDNGTQVVELDAMHSTSPQSLAELATPRQEQEIVERAPVAVMDEATVITEQQRPMEPAHAEVEDAARPTIEITCFGAFTVSSGGRELSWECEVNGENSAFHKEWELLAYVASHEPRGVSTEKMAVAIWPRNDPRTVTESTVHSVTSRLRMLLRRQVEGLAGNVIRIERRLCRLDVTRVRSDAHRFLALIQTSGPGRQAALEEAVGLYRGDLLAASAWTWVHERPINETRSPHERFRNDLFQATQELAATYLALGQPGRAIPLYRRMIELDPLNEPAFLKLVECRKRTGQCAELKRDGLWVRERIRDFMYDPDDSEDNRDRYDLEPAMRAAWERALRAMAVPQHSSR